MNGLAPGMEDKRYAPGKWSIRQIIGHLADGERVFSLRAFHFSRCDPAPLPGFDENEYVKEARFERVPIKDLLAELVHLRRATMYLYRGLDEKALMRRGVANGIENSVRALAFVIAQDTSITILKFCERGISRESSLVPRENGLYRSRFWHFANSRGVRTSRSGNTSDSAAGGVHPAA